ncbi:hypothetical protein KKE78_02670 [Patescibacteria group bacterium]|nr:hypothetical protein [Patescibacteria group bacterium]
MFACNACKKGVRKIAFSRHKKGSSGAGGTWALRAPIHKRTQKPNLHIFKGKKYCTKCLRAVKAPLKESLGIRSGNPADKSTLVQTV